MADEPQKSNRTTITEHERLALIGLLTLASRHNAALLDIEVAAAAIVQELDGAGAVLGANGGGHTSDAVWSLPPTNPVEQADTLLKRLGLSVEG